MEPRIPYSFATDEEQSNSLNELGMPQEYSDVILTVDYDEDSPTYGKRYAVSRNYSAGDMCEDIHAYSTSALSKFIMDKAGDATLEFYRNRIISGKLKDDIISVIGETETEVLYKLAVYILQTKNK